MHQQHPEAPVPWSWIRVQVPISAALGAGQGKVRHLGGFPDHLGGCKGVIHCPTQPQHMAWPRAGSYPTNPNKRGLLTHHTRLPIPVGGPFSSVAGPIKEVVRQLALADRQDPGDGVRSSRT